ncbi:MAG: BatD family protein [Crocinitomicaceae bacterium]
MKLYILTVLISCSIYGQQAAVDVSVNKTTVTDSEPFTYQVTADCDCEITPADFDAAGFDLLDRQQGQFTSSQWINGQSSQQCNITMTYVLKARKQGVFTIDASRVKCKGKDARSEKTTITVVDANQIHKENAGKVSYYYQLSSDKKTVYVGEPFILTFSIYSEKLPEEISGIIPGGASGIWKKKLFEEMEPGFRFTRYTEKVKGKTYHVIELRKEVCFADHPGNVHIDSYFGRAVEMRRFLDASYYEGYSNNLDIQVKKATEKELENYYGLAGDFEITQELGKTNLKANRTFKMSITISGTGNFHLLKMPQFNFPDSFLGVDPDVEENLTVTEKGMEGTVTYQYELTPTRAGKYHFEPYSFTYFIPESKTFKSITTSDFTIVVSEGKDPEIYSSVSDDSQLAVENDIRHIHKGELQTFTYSDFIFGRLAYWGLLLFPILFLFIFLSRKQRKAAKTADEVIKDQQKTAKRSVLKELQKMKMTDVESASKKIKGLLEEYLMTQLNMRRSALSKSSVKEQLKSFGVKEQELAFFDRLWNQLEMTRYAATSEENLSELRDHTQALITALNKTLNKTLK